MPSTSVNASRPGERFLAELEVVVPWAGLVTLFALSNLWMARRQLLADAGEVHL